MKRIVPDKPGWYWGRWDDETDDVPIIVFQVDSGTSTEPDGPVLEDEWVTFGPPIPSPAVCTALADYAAKLAAWDARPQEGDAAHAFGDAGLVDGLAAALRDARGKS